MKNATIVPLAGPQVRFRYDVICDLNKTKYATGPPHCKESCEWLITIERLILSQLSNDLCINCSFYHYCCTVHVHICPFLYLRVSNVHWVKIFIWTSFRLQSSTGRLK